MIRQIKLTIINIRKINYRRLNTLYIRELLKIVNEKHLSGGIINFELLSNKNKL